MTDVERAAHAIQLTEEDKKHLIMFAQGRRVNNTWIGQLFHRDFICQDGRGGFELTELGATTLRLINEGQR